MRRERKNDVSFCFKIKGGCCYRTIKSGYGCMMHDASGLHKEKLAVVEKDFNNSLVIVCKR